MATNKKPATPAASPTKSRMMVNVNLGNEKLDQVKVAAAVAKGVQRGLTHRAVKELGQVEKAAGQLIQTAEKMVKSTARPAGGRHHIEYYKNISDDDATDAKWYWRMREENKKIVADSGQGYTRRATVEKQLIKLHADLGLRVPVVLLDLETGKFTKTLIQEIWK